MRDTTMQLLAQSKVEQHIMQFLGELIKREGMPCENMHMGHVQDLVTLVLTTTMEHWETMFTDDEIKEIINFYASPVGIKMLGATNSLIQELEMVLQPKIMEYAHKHNLDLP